MRSQFQHPVALMFFTITLLTISCGVLAQTGGILDTYIVAGMENNLALKQKELNLSLSIHALKEANGLFYPSAELNAQYMLASGGRSIEMPVGDMLNGVYSSLNSILESMGQTGGFPQIANQEITFLPNDYHDTKIRVITPLVNAEIYYNRKIKQEMITGSQAEINVYKRELIKEIKTSYFRYLQTLKVVDAYHSALELVNEARRVNQKLVENQMAGPEKLFRIDAEVSKVTAELAKAESDRNTAASYFNFLLNRPLQYDIIIDSLLFGTSGKSPVTITRQGEQQREELHQLNSALKSTGYYVNMKKAYVLPEITNVTDIGYQGYAYKFDKSQQYIMNTINLSWPLFNGFRNRNELSRAKIETDQLRHKLDETVQQIEMQCRIAESNLLASGKAEEASSGSLNSSKAYYKVVSKQYAIGQKSLLDLLDARNQLTSSEIYYAVSHFDTLIRLTELERVYAAYDLDNLTR
ncbi:MAG: TolC family protein [Bacteroidales bacterium]|nr:TolC family protein [Bacteroidales bacterium]